jgi:hypothetical protein
MIPVRMERQENPRKRPEFNVINLFYIVTDATFKYFHLSLIFACNAGACVIRLIMAVITDFRNKLECLSLASLSSLVKSLWVRLGAYPKVEHLKGYSLG